MSAACYWLASFFHGQYAQAHGAVSRAISSGVSPDGLASPETYFTRAELMFLVAILVCVLAVVLAARHRHWLDWLAVLVVIAIALAIPMFVLWRA